MAPLLALATRYVLPGIGFKYIHNLSNDILSHQLKLYWSAIVHQLSLVRRASTVQIYDTKIKLTF